MVLINSPPSKHTSLIIPPFQPKRYFCSHQKNPCMKLTHYLFLASCFVSSFLYSQNAKLSGKITEETGEPLISANVVIDASKGWAAVTDFDGNYEISVPAGTYEVSFRYIGKEEQRVKVTLAADEKRSLNITLKEKQQLIDVVVVTGSK